jgi:hypothetical protein
MEDTPPPQKRAAPEQRRQERLEEDVCIHVCTASSALVGVCLTVIGLFRVTAQLQRTVFFGDDLVAFDAVLFLLSCGLSYWALRTRTRRRRYRVEQLADGLFLIALCLMALICALVAYELL